MIKITRDICHFILDMWFMSIFLNYLFKIKILLVLLVKIIYYTLPYTLVYICAFKKDQTFSLTKLKTNFHK